MGNNRQLPASDYIELKAYTRLLIRLCGGLDAAADITRVSAPTLSRYGNHSVEYMENFAPIDIIADMEAELGDSVVSTALTSLNQKSRIPHSYSPKDICKQGQILTKELGEFHAAVLEADEGGTWSCTELGRIKKEAEDIILTGQMVLQQIVQLMTRNRREF